MQRLGLNVLPFLFCSGFSDVFFQSGADCYTFSVPSTLLLSLRAGDRRRGLREESASALLYTHIPPVTRCVPMSTGNTFGASGAPRCPARHPRSHGGSTGWARARAVRLSPPCPRRPLAGLVALPAGSGVSCPLRPPRLQVRGGAARSRFPARPRPVRPLPGGAGRAAGGAAAALGPCGAARAAGAGGGRWSVRSCGQ